MRTEREEKQPLVRASTPAPKNNIEPTFGTRVSLVLVRLLFIAIPLIISIGRILSSAGQAAFYFPQFEAYIKHDSNNSTLPSPANPTSCAQSIPPKPCMGSHMMYAALAVIVCNIIVNLGTRVPELFSVFSGYNDHIAKKLINPSQENDINDDQMETDPLEEDLPPAESIDSVVLDTFAGHYSHHAVNDGTPGYFDLSGLSFWSGFFYILFKILNLLSSGFVGLSTYLSIKSLCEFLEQCVLHRDLGENNPELRMYLYEATALFFVVTAILNNFIYSGLEADNNARSLIKHFADKKELPALNTYIRALLLTIITVIASFVNTPPLAFFSTSAALRKICWIVLPDHIIDIIAALSGITALTAAGFTAIPATFKLFSSDTVKPQYNHPLLPVYQFLITAAGLGDSGANGISNVVGVVSTVSKVLKIDAYSPALIAGATITSLSGTVSAYSFGVLKGVAKGKKTFFKAYEIKPNLQMPDPELGRARDGYDPIDRSRPTSPVSMAAAAAAPPSSGAPNARLVSFSSIHRTRLGQHFSSSPDFHAARAKGTDNLLDHIQENYGATSSVAPRGSING